MSYGITKCYLPPDRGDMPAFTPAEAGTRFSDPRGMQGWVNLDTAVKVREARAQGSKAAHCSGRRNKHNRPWWDSNPGPHRSQAR